MLGDLGFPLTDDGGGSDDEGHGCGLDVRVGERVEVRREREAVGVGV